jgi:phosphoglucomutase
MENIIQHWQNHPNLDPHLKEELKTLRSEQLKDAFFQAVPFGTAGMRGLLGVGTNRLNVHTIRKANVAFAKYLLQYPKTLEKGVAIAYDNRYMSQTFALESAKVLASFNIPSFVFKELRPTPELSFAVRKLGCVGGIVITASHNPKEYNGYKIYDEHGCQLVPHLMDQVIAEIDSIEDELEIVVSLNDKQASLIHWLGVDMDDAYHQAVLGIQLFPNMDKSNIKLVFSPQHGTAHIGVNTLFNAMKVPFVEVLEQANPDPAFSNTKSPNPEEKQAYDLAIEYAKKEDADAVLTTDPDADRVGIVVKHQGEYHLLTGNQTGSIIIEYLLSSLKALNRLPKNGVIFNTVVTSDLGEKIANHYGVEVEKTLTGFKFIGDKIASYEKTHEKSFIMGYEESYGYLIESFVRDKDALQACVILAEAISYYKHQGLTLVDVLNQLYQNYGYHLEDQMSLTLTGEVGVNKIKAILSHFRESAIEDFAGIKVKSKEDYLKGIKSTGTYRSVLNFPSSDVIKYAFEEGSWLAIRPSGTEPKCKFYFCILGEDFNQANEKYNAIKQALQTHIA